MCVCVCACMFWIQVQCLWLSPIKSWLYRANDSYLQGLVRYELSWSGSYNWKKIVPRIRREGGRPSDYQSTQLVGRRLDLPAEVLSIRKRKQRLHFIGWDQKKPTGRRSPDLLHPRADRSRSRLPRGRWALLDSRRSTSTGRSRSPETLTFLIVDGAVDISRADHAVGCSLLLLS